jgi:hypothetical protein
MPADFCIMNSGFDIIKTSLLIPNLLLSRLHKKHQRVGSLRCSSGNLHQGKSSK